MRFYVYFTRVLSRLCPSLSVYLRLFMLSKMISLSSLFTPRKQTLGDWTEGKLDKGKYKFPRSKRNKGTLSPGNNEQYHCCCFSLAGASVYSSSLWGGGKVTSLQGITIKIWFSCLEGRVHGHPIQGGRWENNSSLSWTGAFSSQRGCLLQSVV